MGKHNTHFTDDQDRVRRIGPKNKVSATGPSKFHSGTQSLKLPKRKPQKLKKAKNITIIGKRWFDKRNGNTYHTATVYADGKLVGKSERSYGYGDMYRQTAHEILQKAGYYPTTGERLASGGNADYYNFMMETRSNRNKFVFDVSDVSRKSDL